MCRLVERIETEPAAGERDGVRVVALLRAGPDQAAERRGELALQGVGLVHLPGVELGAVAQREALEQIPTEQLDRFLQLDRRRPLGGELAKAAHVDGEAVAVAQRDAVARRIDPLLSHGAAQDRERPPQRAASVIGILLGPEQLAQRLARPRALG